MQSKYKKQTAWNAEHTTHVSLKLSHLSDADILDWLKDKPSKQGAIKALIRADIEKHEHQA